MNVNYVNGNRKASFIKHLQFQVDRNDSQCNFKLDQ